MERLAIICTTCFKLVDLSRFNAVDRAVSHRRDWLVCGSIEWR